MDFSLTDAEHSAERAQALPFTRIPPSSRGESFLFALFISFLTTNDPLRRSGLAIALRWTLLLATLVAVAFYLRYRIRINGTMPSMLKAPPEIKRAYAKFAATYLALFLAGFLSSILLPMPLAWLSPPITLVGMYACVRYYEKWYYEGVRAVEDRLA